MRSILTKTAGKLYVGRGHTHEDSGVKEYPTYKLNAPEDDETNPVYAFFTRAMIERIEAGTANG